MTRFKFGRNWSNFSRAALTPGKVQESREDFFRLVDRDALKGKRFLDIGFGQGLTALIAAEAGAAVVALDIDRDNLSALQRTRRFFSPELDVEVVIGSILDPQDLAALASQGPFDVVHSWGVLHHTGAMSTAIAHAAKLVASRGSLVIALYQRHWSSPAWWLIKWLYNHLPHIGQQLLVAVLTPVIILAKAIVVGGNPFRKERGMSFYYDLIDWVGGFPYECVTADELKTLLEALGFAVKRIIRPAVPTGCIEIVAERC